MNDKAAQHRPTARKTTPRYTPRQATSRAGRGERTTPEGQRESGQGGQAAETDGEPSRGHSKQKKTGRGFHSLIPVSRPSYLMGIGLSEAPTICSTCATAAFLVLKP